MRASDLRFARRVYGGVLPEETRLLAPQCGVPNENRLSSGSE